MTRTLTLAEKLAGFTGQHGHQVLNALRNQERHMREAAEEALRAAWCPQGPPREPTPGYIDCTPTPAGFAGLAETFSQAADAAAAAADAWEELTEEVEEEWTAW
jgi:hypothetical protein